MIIKKYITDTIIIIIVFALSVVLAGKPVINWSPGAAMTVDQKASAKKIKEEEKQETSVQKPPDTYAALGKRNIFSETGAYAVMGNTSSALPENPYKLVAVLQGKDKKAVFKNYAGGIFTGSVGQKMMDGYVVENIDVTTVKLKWENKIKKLSVFNPEGAPAPVFPEDKKKVPANPYRLLGILSGAVKKAVIKDYTNAVMIKTLGDSLPDGSIITGIGDVSVKLKKSNENVILKIFGNQSP